MKQNETNAMRDVFIRVASRPAGAASVTEVKTEWDKVARRAESRPIEVYRRGERAAVLLSVNDYQRIVNLAELIAEKMEDAEDLADYAQCKSEPSYPFDKLVDELKRDGLL